MMSDLILLSLTDPPSVIFILLPQSFKIQHPSTDTQLGRAVDPLTLDGFASPGHLHAGPQICHCVCPFFHCTSHLKKAETEPTSSWDAFIGTLFIHYPFFMYLLLEC